MLVIEFLMPVVLALILIPLVIEFTRVLVWALARLPISLLEKEDKHE